MDEFGKISSFESLPLPEGRHVRDFDAAQAAAKRAARDANKAVPPSAVTRQMSRNLVVMPAVRPPAFQSVSDFVDAYTTTDKTIADLTAEFVVKAGEAKQKQDDILPHLAYMQSLLSKKGANHAIVIEARKQGNKIPWWTDYYEMYKDKLWQSLRTMERRIAAYRSDPSVSAAKPGKDGSKKPKHLTQLEHKLLGTAVNAREAIVDLRAGRIDEAIAKLDKNTPTQDRIDEHLERGVSPTHVNPDGDAKSQADISEQLPGREEPVETPPAPPARAVPETATYRDWENHSIPAPEFKLKYFAVASGNFTDRFRHAVRGSAFAKILDMLKNKPRQALANAHDFGNLAVVLRSAADDLSLLAAAITTSLTHPMEPEPARTQEVRQKTPNLAQGEASVDTHAPPVEL